jgi:hypothetical protein
MTEDIPTKRGPDVIGTAEVCEILDVPRSSISRWLKAGRDSVDANKGWPSNILPQPIASLASGFVWRRGDIERFAEQRAAVRADRERAAEPAAA